MVADCDTRAKVTNERWSGKYTMVCDVIFPDRIVSGVSVSALPPHGLAEVFIPNGIALTAEEESNIDGAVLAHYWGIDAL
jgi:hypothetical protein